jgi:hypothetical protein
MKHTGRAIQRGIRSPTLLGDGSLAMTLTMETGRVYRVECTADLAAWSTLTNFVSTSFTTRFVDTTATNAAPRYYRLVTELGTENP